MLLAAMAAASIGGGWVSPHFNSGEEIPRDTSPELESANAKIEAAKSVVSAEIIEKARLKRERKAARKLSK